MKHANKIVALLLCLTLLVSAMAIFVSAAETAAEPETEATQAQSVEPNCTVSAPQGQWTFSQILANGKYAADGNAYRYSTTNYSQWNRVTNGANKFVSMRTQDTNVKFEPDFFPRTADSSTGATATWFKIKDYNTMVTQFEIIKTGECDNISVTSLIRGGGGYRLADAIKLNDLLAKANVKNGELAQITVVMHATFSADNVITAKSYYFVNGVYVNVLTAGGFTAAMTEGAEWYGVRFCAASASGSGVNLVIDNIDARVYNGDVLDDKHFILDEYNPYKAEGFNSLVDQLPTIATVDGVEYNTVSAINAELAKPHSVPAEVVFLHDYTQIWEDKVAIKCNAVINTNGFVTADNLDLTNAHSYAVNGNVISTFAPNFTTSTSGFGSAIKSDFANNEFSTSTSVDAAAAGDWEIITTADGNEFANFHQKANRELEAAGSNGNLIRWDFVTSGSTYAKNTPSFTVQFEMIRTGKVDGMDVGVLGKYNGSYLLNDAAFNFNVMNNYPIGEAVQFTVNFGATKNADGTGLVTVDTYINGVHYKRVTKALTATKTTDETTGETVTTSQYDGFTWTGLRLPIAEKMALNEVALDNMYIRGFNTNVLGEKGLLPTEYNQFARADHKKVALPEVALVDGAAVGYGDIEALLADGANHEVELLHKPWRAITVQSNATIKTNGYIGYIVAGDGYVLEEADGVATVAPDDRLTNIKVTLGGQTLTTIEGALYSANHEEIIRNHSFDNALHKNSVYYKDGKYYELVWDFSAKPEYAEEITYEVTLVEHPVILIVNADTNEVVTGKLVYTDGVLTSGIQLSFPAIFYFNADVDSTATLTSDGATQKLTFELNGHTYNFTTPAENPDTEAIEAVQAFAASNNDEFTFRNGKIVTNGNGPGFLIGSSSNGVTTFENVTLENNILLADWRAGTLNFNNCTIYGSQISIGARIPADAFVNFDNCTINSGIDSFISFYDNDQWGYGAASQTNYKRHVTITNSVLNLYRADAALVSMPKEDCINVAEGEVNDRLVYVANSTVYANRAYLSASYDGVVKFGEGVKYAFANNTDAPMIQTDDGVMLGVKTNDIRFDYVATANYKTVNWANDVVELWELGATPVASDPADKATQGTAAGYKLLANLTLHADIFFNIYADGATLVTINGKTIEGVDGKYAYELLPASALGDIYVAITFADGSVYTRATTLMEYVNESAEDTSYTYYAQLIQVYANMLQYLLDVQNYECIRYARAEADAFLADPDHAATTDAVDNKTASAENTLKQYFASATFQLDGEVKLVLTLQDGVTVDAVTVGDEAVEPIDVDGKLYVEIPAYLLTETVEVTIGEATVEYSLGAYVETAKGNAKTAATSLYSYAAAAKAYEAACNPVVEQ